MCGVQATQVYDVVSQARGTRPYDACVIQSWLFCVVDVCRPCQERTSILDFNINSYTSKVLDIEHQISRVVCVNLCTINVDLVDDRLTRCQNLGNLDDMVRRSLLSHNT